MDDKHMKRSSTFLVIREMQINTTMTFHSSLSEWLQKLKHTVTKAGGDVESLEPSCLSGGNPEWYSHFGALAVSDNVKHTLAVWSSSLLLGIYPRKMKTYIHAEIYMQKFTVVLFTIVKNRK